MRTGILVATAAAVFAAPAALAAQSADAGAARVLDAVRVADGAPVIDGRLDEPAWENAAPATGFVQRMPDPGEPASLPTEARVLYDDQAIYVGLRMYDPDPEGIPTQLGRRDLRRSFSDWVHVVIDSYHDRRTAFRFGVNPSGVQKDVLHFDDVREDIGWDAVWASGTQIDSLGWTAELRIPFSQLRFSTDERGEGGLVWGVNFWREIARENEHSFWTPVPPDFSRFVSEAGELRGLRGIRPPRRLEVMPYTVGRITRAPGDPANPFYSPTELFGSAGLDLKLGLTSDLTLTATVNPDFGQVEADPARVNLGPFELFFPEQRPFFTEGTEIFSLGIGPNGGGAEQLFYSRRIGRNPQRVPRVPGGYVDMPEATRILGAAKVSGQTGPWSVGVLNAVTGVAEARLADAGGMLGSEPVEPLTSYSVARVSRNFREGQSGLGAIFTATNRNLTDERFAFLTSAAYSGGVDGRHRFGGGTYQLSGSLLASHVLGSEEAIARLQLSPARFFQRPDADHVEFDPTRTSLTGWNASAGLERIGGEHWRWGVLGLARSPGFEVNDLGFQQFADMLVLGGHASYNVFRPGTHFRRWSASAGFFPGWTFALEPVQISGSLNFNGQLQNFWNVAVGLGRSAAAYSPFHLRGGTALLEPGRTNARAAVSTDSRKPVSGSLSVNGGVQDRIGSRSVSVSPGITVRPAGHVDLTLSPTLSFNDDAWQYVQTVQYEEEPRYIFGRIEQTTVSLTARLNYTFTPDLTLQLYPRPYLSGGAFSAFREVADPRAPVFEDRVPLLPEERLVHEPENRRYGFDVTGDLSPDLYFRDPDFTRRLFNSNAVLRWEYRPGSTLFVVWSQGRSAADQSGDFGVGRDLERLFAAPPANTLLVKLNYWIDL